MSNLKILEQQIRSRLPALSETPGLDAQVLLAQVLGRKRSWVLAHPEAQLTARQAAQLEASLARLEAGEPLPYVLGVWEFYGLDFRVDSSVLIPRPETELLVEQALAWLDQKPGKRRAADVGTGSGCIAVVLAVNAPGLQVIASDISPGALKTAASNIRRHSLEGRIQLVQMDLFSAVRGSFDLVCANLPYIPSETLKSLRVRLWEPGLALDGGQDGLAQIRRLLAQVEGRLSAGGLALLEIEERQGQAAHELARLHFPGAEIMLLQDLAGKDRLLKIQVR